MTFTPGTRIDENGTFLGGIRLDRSANWVLTVDVTAVSGQTASLQCQLYRTDQPNWDAIGQDDLAARASVSLQRAYPAVNTWGLVQTVGVGCRASTGDSFVVESGQILAWHVTRVAGGGGPTLSSRQMDGLNWPDMD